MTEGEIKVSGLTQLELRELEEKLGKGSVRVIDKSDATLREPLTIIAAVAISSVALKALTVIATRPRSGTKKSITLETLLGKYTYTREEQSSGTPPPKQIEAIGKALSIDLKALGSIAKTSSTTD
jgi:hypothetical protein